jgi:hypothetical protein
MTSSQNTLTVNLDHMQVPCACTMCAQQFQNLADSNGAHTYVSFISRQEGEQYLSQRLATVEQDRLALVKLLGAGGDTFLGRWKKSKKKRTAYLGEAFPDRQLVSSDSQQSKPTQNILLIWLRWDDIVDNAILLPKLLEARSRKTGQEWFALDLAMTQPGWDARQYRLQWCGAIDRLENISVVAYGLAFGQLVPWTAAEAHRLDTIGFPRAEIVISSQEMLISMLRKLVETVLQTPAGTTATNVRWQELASRQFRPADDLELRTTLGTQTFGPPPAFTPRAVLDAFRGRLQEAEDFVWLLQTDPWQLSAAIEAVRYSDMSKMVGPDSFYRHAVYSIAILPIRRLQEWKFMVQECEHLVNTHQRFKTEIKPGKEPPREYQDALACWQVMLSHMLAVRSRDLEHLLPRLKAFEQHFLIEDDIVDGMGVISSERKDSSIATISAKDPLFACLTMLAISSVASSTVQANAAFDRLEVFIREEHVGSKKSRLEVQLLDTTTDLGTVWKAFQGTKLARPAFKERRVGEACELGKGRPFWTICGREIDKKPKLLPPPVKLAGLLESFDRELLPSGPKTQKWLDKFDSVNRHCKDFWDEFRLQEARALNATGCTKADIKSCISWISYDEEPEHLSELDGERQKILKPKPNESKQSGTQPPPAVKNWSAGQDGLGTVSNLPERSRPKEKTRPAPDAGTAEPLVPALPSPTTSEGIPQVTLKRDASVILLRSLMRDDDGTGPRATHWNNVVAALDDAGFSATTTGGSEVAFSNAGMHQSIVFHKPHPDPKCTKRMLEGMGKRLSRRFGWTAVSFVREDGGAGAGHEL